MSMLSDSDSYGGTSNSSKKPLIIAQTTFCFDFIKENDNSNLTQQIPLKQNNFSLYNCTITSTDTNKEELDLLHKQIFIDNDNSLNKSFSKSPKKFQIYNENIETIRPLTYDDLFGHSPEKDLEPFLTKNDNIHEITIEPSKENLHQNQRKSYDQIETQFEISQPEFVLSKEIPSSFDISEINTLASNHFNAESSINFELSEMTVLDSNFENIILNNHLFEISNKPNIFEISLQDGNTDLKSPERQTLSKTTTFNIEEEEEENSDLESPTQRQPPQFVSNNDNNDIYYPINLTAFNNSKVPLKEFVLSDPEILITEVMNNYDDQHETRIERRNLSTSFVVSDPFSIDHCISDSELRELLKMEEPPLEIDSNSDLVSLNIASVNKSLPLDISDMFCPTIEPEEIISHFELSQPNHLQMVLEQNIAEDLEICFVDDFSLSENGPFDNFTLEMTNNDPKEINKIKSLIIQELNTFNWPEIPQNNVIEDDKGKNNIKLSLSNTEELNTSTLNRNLIIFEQSPITVNATVPLETDKSNLDFGDAAFSEIDKNDSNNKQSRIEELEKENADKQQQIDELEKDNLIKQEDINSKQQQIDNLEKENSAKQQEIDNKQQQIDNLEKENAAKQQEIDNKQQQIDNLEKENAAKQQEIDDKQQQIDNLEKENAAKQQEIDDKQQHINELEKENATKQDDINSKQHHIDNLEKENAAKQQDIDDKQQHINELEKEIANKQNDINSKQQHIEELENVIRNIPEEPDSKIQDKELKDVNERTNLSVSNFELNELVESKINNDNIKNSIEISQPESLVSRLEEEIMADDLEDHKQHDTHEKPEVHISNAWLLESAKTEDDLEKVTPNIDNKIALQVGNEIAPETNLEDNKIILELGNEIASETNQTDEITHEISQVDNKIVLQVSDEIVSEKDQTDEIEPEINHVDKNIVLELGNEIAPEISQVDNKIVLQVSDEIVSEKSQTSEIEPEISQEEQTSNKAIENSVANIELSYPVYLDFDQQMPILTTSIFNDIFSSSNSQIQTPNQENKLQVSYPQISEIHPVESQIATEISAERNRLPTLSLSLPIEVDRQPIEIDDTFDSDQHQTSNENAQIRRNVSLSPSPTVYNETSLQHPIVSLSDPNCLFSPSPMQTEIDTSEYKNILFISEPTALDKEIEVDFTNSPISHIASIRLEKKQKQLDLQQQSSSNWSSWTDFDETPEQRNHLAESELQCIEINAKLEQNLEIDETENYEIIEQIVPSVTREIQNIPQRRIKLEINESSIYCQESETENEPKLKLIRYENFSKEPLELFKFPPDISPELNICNNEPTFEKVPQIEYESTFTTTENYQVEIETQTETENPKSKSISDLLYYETPLTIRSSLTIDDESIVNNEVSNESQQLDENIEREQVEFSISTPEILPIETLQFDDLYENQPSTSIDDKSIIKYEQNDKPVFEISDTVHENTFKQESHQLLSIVNQPPEFIKLDNKLSTSTNEKSNEIGNEDTKISEKSVKSEIAQQLEFNQETVIFDQSPSPIASTTLNSSSENQSREEISFSLSRPEILPIETSSTNNLTSEQEPTIIDDKSIIKYEQNTTPIFEISDTIHKGTYENEESQNLNQQEEKKEIDDQSNSRIRGEIDNIISYDFTTKEEDVQEEEKRKEEEKEKVQLEISNLNEYTKSEQTTETSGKDEYVKRQINLSITAQNELYEIFEDKVYSTENEHQFSLINNINEIEIISTETKKPKFELSDKIEQTTNDFELSKFIEISPLTTIYEQESEAYNTKSLSLINANEIFNQTPNTIRSIPTDETQSEHRPVPICSTVNSYEKYDNEITEETKEPEEPNPNPEQELSYSKIETFYIESQTTFELSSPLQYSIEYMRQQEEPKATLLTNEGSYNSFEIKETETEENQPTKHEQQHEHYQLINPTISSEPNTYERFQSNDEPEFEPEPEDHNSGINFSISKPEIIVEENETKDEIKQKRLFFIDEESLLDVESATTSPTFDLSETIHETAIEEPDFIDNKKESNNDNQIANLLSFDYSLKPEDEEQTNTVQDQIPKQQITLSIEPQDELYQLFEDRLCSQESNKQFSIISKINEFEIIPNKPTIKLSHMIEQSSFNDDTQHSIELSPLNTVYEHQLIKSSNTISRIQEINIEPLELKHDLSINEVEAYEIIHQKEDEIPKQEQKNKLKIGNENHIELDEAPSVALNISGTTFLFEKKLRQKHKSESPVTKNIHQVDFQHKHYVIEDIEPEMKPVKKGIELSKVEHKLEINEETVIYDQSPASRERIDFPLEINESSIYCQESKTENEPKLELIRCEKESFSKEPLELFKFPPDISPELNICNNEPTFEKVPQIEYESTFTTTENDQVEIETQTETENQKPKSISDLLYYETPLTIRSTPTIDDNSVLNHEYNNFTETHSYEISNLLSYDYSTNDENQQFEDQEISEKSIKSEIAHQFELNEDTVIFDQSPSPIASTTLIGSSENQSREEISFSLSRPEILPIETSSTNNLTSEQEPTIIDENSLIKYEQNSTPIFEISDIIHENTFRQEHEREEEQKSHRQLSIENQPAEFIELDNKLNASEKSIETIVENQNQQRDLQHEHYVIENIAPEIKIEDKENRFHFEIHPETIIYDQSPIIEINNELERNESKGKKETEEKISFSISTPEILPIETSSMNNLTSEQEPTIIDENSLLKYEQNTTPIFEISDIIHENTFKQEQEEEQKEFKDQSNTRIRGEIDNIISYDFTTKEEEGSQEEEKVQLEISNLNEYTKSEQTTETSGKDEYIKRQINLSITAQDELYEIFEDKLYSTENEHQFSLINNINEIEIISTETKKARKTKKPKFELSDKIEQTTNDFELSKFIEISPLTTIYEQESETETENTKSLSLINTNEIFNQTPNTIRSIPTDETQSEHRSVPICSTVNSYEKYDNEIVEETKEPEEPNPNPEQELSYSKIETFYIESQTTFELSSPLQYSIEYFSQQMLNFNINKQESIDITNSDVEQKNLPETKTFILTNEGSYNSFEVKEANSEKEEIKPIKYEQEEQRTIFDQAPTIETQEEHITFTISPTEVLPIEEAETIKNIIDDESFVNYEVKTTTTTNQPTQELTLSEVENYEIKTTTNQTPQEFTLKEVENYEIEISTTTNQPAQELTISKVENYEISTTNQPTQELTVSEVENYEISTTSQTPQEFTLKEVENYEIEISTTTSQPTQELTVSEVENYEIKATTSQTQQQLTVSEVENYEIKTATNQPTQQLTLNEVENYEIKTATNQPTQQLTLNEVENYEIEQPSISSITREVPTVLPRTHEYILFHDEIDIYEEAERRISLSINESDAFCEERKTENAPELVISEHEIISEEPAQSAPSSLVIIETNREEIARQEAAYELSKADEFYIQNENKQKKELNICLNETIFETESQNQQRDLQHEHYVIENIAPEIKIEDKENRFNFEIHPETIIYDQSPTIEINDQLERNESKENKETEEEISFSISTPEILPIETSSMNNLTSEQQSTIIDENSLLKYEQNTTPIFEISDIIHENTFKQEQEEEEKQKSHRQLSIENQPPEFIKLDNKLSTNTKEKSNEIGNLIEFNSAYEDQEISEKSVKSEIAQQFELNEDTVIFDQSPSQIASSENQSREEISFSISTPEILPIETSSTNNLTSERHSTIIDENSLIKYEQNTTPIFEISDIIHENTFKQEHEIEQKFSIENQPPEFIELTNEPIININTNEKPNEIDNLVSFDYSLNQEQDTKSYDLTNFDEIFNQNPSSAQSTTTETADKVSDRPELNICYTENAFEEFNESDEQKETQLDENEIKRSLSYSQIEAFSVESQPSFELSSPSQISTNFGQENEENSRENDVELAIGESEFYELNANELEIDEQATRNISKKVEAFEIMELESFSFYKKDDGGDDEEEEEEDKNDKEEPVNADEDKKKRVLLINDNSCNSFEIKEKVIKLTHEQEEQRTIFDQAPTIETQEEHITFTISPTEVLPIEEAETIKNIIDDESFVNYEVKTTTTTNQPTQELTLSEVENYEIKTTTTNQPTQELTVSEVENYEISTTNQTAYTISEVENFEIEQPIISSVSRDIIGNAKQECLFINEENVFVFERKEESSIELDITETTNESFLVKESYELSEINDVFDSSKQQQQLELTICKNEIIFEEANEEEPKATLLTNEGSYNSFEIKETETEENQPTKHEQQHEHYQLINPTISSEPNAYERFQSNDEPSLEPEPEDHNSGINFSISKPEIIVEENETKDENETNDITEQKQPPSISDDSITSFEIKEAATQQSVIDEQSLLNAESRTESPSFELSEAILQNALDLAKSNDNEAKQATPNIKDRQITSFTIQHQNPEYIQIESKPRSIEMSPLDVIYEDESSSPSLIVNHSAVSISETKEIFEQISSESSSNMEIAQNQTIFDQKVPQNNVLQYSKPDSYFISDTTSFELSEPSQYSMRFLSRQQLNIAEFEGIDIINEDAQQNNKNDVQREAVKLPLSINEDSSFEINEREEENQQRQHNASYENQTTIIYDQTPLKTSTRNESPSLSPEVLSYEINGESIIKPTIDSGSAIELEYNEIPEFSLSEIYRENIIRIRNEPEETKKPKEPLHISLHPQSYEQSASYNDKEYYELTTNDVFSLEQQETTTKSAPPIHNEINLDVSPSLVNELNNKLTANYSVHNEINLDVSPSLANEFDNKFAANHSVHNEINLDVSPSLINEFDDKLTTNHSVYNEVQLSLSPSELPIHSEKKSDLIISESSAKDIVSETASKQPNFDLVLGQQFDLVPSSSRITLTQSLPCEYQTPSHQDDQFEISSLKHHLEYKEADSFMIENQPNIAKSNPVTLSLSDANCQIDAKVKYNDQKLSESYFLSMNIMNDGSDSSDEIDTTNVKERDFSVRERLIIKLCEETCKDFINDSNEFSISSFNQADYSPRKLEYEILNVNSFDIHLDPKETNKTLSISDKFVQFEKENHEIQLIPKPIEKSLQTTNNDYAPVLFDSPVFHFGFSQIESKFIPSVFLEISEDVFEVNLDSTTRPLNATIEEVDQFSVDLSEPKKTEGSFIVDDENENISIILSNGLSYSYVEYYESINDNNIDEDVESLSSISGDARLMLIKRQMKEISELHQENVKKDVTIESLKSKYSNLKSAARECLMKHFSDVRRLTDDNVNLMEQVESLHKLLGSNLDSAQQSILGLMRKKIIASLEFSDKTTVFECIPTKSSLVIDEDAENVVDLPRFSSGLNVLVTFTNEDIEPSKNEEIFSKERKVTNYKAGRLYLSNAMASINVSNLSFSNLRTAGKITVFSQPPSYRLFPLKVSDLLNSSIFEKPETKNNFSFTFSHLRVSKPKVPPVLHLEDNLTIAHIFTSLPPSQNQQSMTVDQQQQEVKLPQTLNQVQKPLRRNIVRNTFFIGNINDSTNTATNQNSLVNNTSSFSILPQKKAKLVQVTNEQFEASAPSHPSDLQLKKTQAFDFAYEISETDSDSIPEIITTRPLMLSIPIVHSSDQNDDDIDVQISYDLIRLSKNKEELKIDDKSSSFFEISEKVNNDDKFTKELENIYPLIDKDYTHSSHIVLNSLQPSDLQISEFDTFEMIPSDSSSLNEENQNEYEMLIAMLRRRVTTLNEELKMQNLRQSELISEMAHIRSNYEVLLRSSRAE